MLGTTARREIIAMQIDIDEGIFDSSLGFPLATYEDATLALVGGKALQVCIVMSYVIILSAVDCRHNVLTLSKCWRLARQGFPIPESFVLPTYVYSMHIGDAGVVDLINEVFASDFTDDAVREATREKLAIIRERIISTPLNSEVVENLESFLDTLNGTPVAVRSSASAEDLQGQSFAGQYDTFLYKVTSEEIVDSIKKCWASMFKTHIIDYATNQVFLGMKEGKDINEPIVFNMKPPKMGVLIMKMIEAKSAGVCFTQNLWGEKNELMIEAVKGQCEGLVSGEITPDRYVIDKHSTNLCYQQLTPQTHKFVRASNMDGVVKVEITEPKDAPVLSRKELKAIALLGRAVEEFYGRPQDLEFAIDEKGALHLLQARPITTINSHGALSFLPPGDGFWTFDPTHFPRPVTPWFQQVYSFEYAEYYGRRTGCLVKNIKLRFVHNFSFSQPDFFAPSDALERAAQAYWNKKIYEDDYREFSDFFRPECEALQEELRCVNPSSLSHPSLVSYVARCYDLAAEFWKRHHSYSLPATIVVGDYANRMGQLMGKEEPLDTLVLLENASPESRGLLNHEDPLLAEMYGLLERSNKAMELLRCDENSATWALDCLLHLPDRLGQVMREVALKYGWRLAGGYDLIVPCMIESPHFFLRSILQGVEEGPDAAKEASARVRKLADEWKSTLPADKHEEFEEILDVGRRFFRIRDERGLCTDLSGVGLCRRGILEAGRRLAEQGIIYEPEHLCVALKSEAIALLQGDLNLLSRTKGMASTTLEIPTPRELERRYKYIKTADPSLIPRALGTPPPPPDFSSLPPGIGRSMAAFATGALRGIWDERLDDEGDEDVRESPDAVKGVPASMGIVEGPVRLVLQDEDLQKVKKGDVVVTYSCSASFNIVLALCAGICTDYGGMLSHAAIVAREYGIPAIVGSQNATSKFKNGDIVRIDSSTATVRIVRRIE